MLRNSDPEDVIGESPYCGALAQRHIFFSLDPLTQMLLIDKLAKGSFDHFRI